MSTYENSETGLLRRFVFAAGGRPYSHTMNHTHIGLHKEYRPMCLKKRVCFFDCFFVFVARCQWQIVNMHRSRLKTARFETHSNKEAALLSGGMKGDASVSVLSINIVWVLCKHLTSLILLILSRSVPMMFSFYHLLYLLVHKPFQFVMFPVRILYIAPLFYWGC